MKLGDIVFIEKPNNKYKELPEQTLVGIVYKTFFKRGVRVPYGVIIKGYMNKKSKDGYYWFDLEQLIALDNAPSIFKENLKASLRQEINLQVKSFKNGKVESEENNMSLDKSYEERERGCNCDSSRGLRREARNSKVVALYFDKKQQEIQNDYDKEREVFITQDTNVISLKAVIDEIQAANPELVRPGIAYYYYVTKATNEAINKLSSKRSEQIVSLDNKKYEVETLLSACTSYEQEMEILKGYGIVNISDTGITM